jgi:hypothetical protein
MMRTLLQFLAALYCLNSSYAFCSVPARSKSSHLQQSSYVDDLSVNPPPQPEEAWSEGPSDEVIAIKNQLLQLSAMTDRYATCVAQNLLGVTADSVCTVKHLCFIADIFGSAAIIQRAASEQCAARGC